MIVDKKLKPEVFWAINSHNYDTYMISSTDRISFKCEDLYRFMEDYAQLCLSAVSGSLPPVDNKVMFADYIQRCVMERGQMTYPSLKDAIKVWDETTERFGGNGEKKSHGDV